MTWNVHYSDDAQQDLHGIYSYISDVLLESATARSQANRMMDAVDSLNHTPLRYRLYAHEPWRSIGLCILPIGNFLVFYLPNETKRTVAIIRIMYGGRDAEKQPDKPGD